MLPLGSERWTAAGYYYVIEYRIHKGLQGCRCMSHTYPSAHQRRLASISYLPLRPRNSAFDNQLTQNKSQHLGLSFDNARH